MIFILRSSRGIALWLSIKALYYGQSQKFPILMGIWKGYYRGWKSLFSH
nr:MAG TPA: hypothetical protein [Bacteriophage sp.]